MEEKIKNHKGTLLGWGRHALKKDGYICMYCGLDGKTDLRVWMQFSIDHVIPKKSEGPHTPDNMVACCRSCNSVTSRMIIPENTTREEAIELKREKVKKRHDEEYKKFWEEHVAVTK